MSDAIYVQCTLERVIELVDGGGLIRKTQVSWLPARFGQVGKVIRLQDDAELWCVTEIGGRTTAKDLEKRARDHKNQRKASDI